MTEKEIQRARSVIQGLNADIRNAIWTALRGAENQTEMESIICIVLALERAARRRESDRETDLRRRKTIAARMPRAEHARHAALARRLGLSCNEYVRRAIDRFYVENFDGEEA